MSVTPPPYVKAHQLLEGKVVIVTAAAGTGIGFATAKRCAEEGAIVAISDIHERRLGEAAEKLEVVMGRRPLALLCNVTVGRTWRSSSMNGEGLGQVDALISNAGLGGTAPRRHD
jgi:3-oxoacyl-[acyl-carrier protein] reductase